MTHTLVCRGVHMEAILQAHSCIPLPRFGDEAWPAQRWYGQQVHWRLVRSFGEPRQRVTIQIYEFNIVTRAQTDIGNFTYLLVY